jgi:hypothetical protein
MLGALKKPARLAPARVLKIGRERSPGISWRRLLPVASGVHMHTAGMRTASGVRRFVSGHPVPAPRYRWWLRRILSRFVVKKITCGPV